MAVHSAVESMLSKYPHRTKEDQTNALKEIIQQLALLGLFRAGFFDKAAFYGGTALRLFHGLPRFSEDLDFSLIKKSTNFSLASFCEAVRTELLAYGFETEVTHKEKAADTAIESAFIKAGTLKHLLKIGAKHPEIIGVHSGELLKIKLEVDTDPPAGATYEVKYLLEPIPFSVRVFSLPSLFAGKVHALLCRNWKGGRVKGRDLHDFVWYVSKNVPLDISHLSNRIRQSGHCGPNETLIQADILQLLNKKFHSIDYPQARHDIIPFIKNPDEVKIWSAEFFSSIANSIQMQNK
jgi:predicted nucleotidyltransferase component of viral defense system